MSQDLTGTDLRREEDSFFHSAAVTLLIFVVINLVTLMFSAGLLFALFEFGAKGTVEDMSLIFAIEDAPIKTRPQGISTRSIR
jgi:hypothetical protein